MSKEAACQLFQKEQSPIGYDRAFFNRVDNNVYLAGFTLSNSTSNARVAPPGIGPLPLSP